MMTSTTFKKRLAENASPFWLRVAVDVSDKNQFYIVGNGGMGTTISAPIEQYLPEIKQCVLDMLSSGELVKNDDATLLLDRNISVYFLKAHKRLTDE